MKRGEGRGANNQGATRLDFTRRGYDDDARRTNKQGGRQADRNDKRDRNETRRDVAQGHGHGSKTNMHTSSRKCRPKQKRQKTGATDWSIKPTRQTDERTNERTNEDESQNEFERANLKSRTTISHILHPSRFERQTNRPLQLPRIHQPLHTLK